MPRQVTQPRTLVPHHGKMGRRQRDKQIICQNSALCFFAWQEMCQHSPFLTFLDFSHLCELPWVFRSLSYSLLTGGSLGFLQLCETSLSCSSYGDNNVAEESHTRDTLMTSYKINQRWKRWFAVHIKKITGTASEI